jgi:hypothetical protein
VDFFFQQASSASKLCPIPATSLVPFDTMHEEKRITLLDQIQVSSFTQDRVSPLTLQGVPLNTPGSPSGRSGLQSPSSTASGDSRHFKPDSNSCRMFCSHICYLV